MLSATVEAPELNRLRARFGEAPRIVREELSAGMDRALAIHAEEVVREIEARTQRRTGRLVGSVAVRRRGGGLLLEGSVVVTAPHARWVNDGTRPHRIAAKRQGGTLRFTVGGKVLYRREAHHPGTKATHFWEAGLAAARPRVRFAFRARLGRVTKRMRAG